ncbi:MAG: hypothetical protein ACYTG6_14760, partial [Planctomycetota bacterium]
MHFADHPSAPPARDRGIAMVIVIAVLVTLVIIAVPFAVSMRQGHERTNTELSRSRAQFEAGLLIENLKQFLGRTHPSQEQELWAGGERSVEADATVDTLSEITPGDGFRRIVEEAWLAALDRDPTDAYRVQALRARGLGPMNDDRGSIWTGIVEDANARVNPNGASPFLIGNLIGGALLAEELDAGATEIPVEFVTSSKLPGIGGFPPDGGYIRIGREVIRYTRFEENTFEGCERGVLTDAPLADNGTAERWDRGTPVIDYTAYKLASHIIASKPGHLSPFRNLADLKSIATWGGDGVLPAERLERLMPYLTVWSQRETAEWLSAQLVMNQLPEATEEGAAEEVDLRDNLANPSGTTYYFNAGTLARVRGGGQTAYQMVQHEGDGTHGQRGRVVTLAGQVGTGQGETTMTFEGGRTVMDARAPYPININTAPIETIYACLANLHLYGADSEEDIVTPEKAWEIAKAIVDSRSGDLQVNEGTGERVGGPWRHSRDYGDFLQALEEAGSISGNQRAALYFNAVNPHNGLLAFGTAPWCYRTLDVYHLEARVSVNDRGGEQIASAAVHEVVEVGSDGKTAWVLESQEDFEQRLSQGSGAKWTATYPFGVNFRNRWTAHIQPAPRDLKAYRDHVYPSTSRDYEAGDVRLEPARIRLPGAVVANHFDNSWYTDGWNTIYSGAYTRKVEGAFRRRDDPYVSSFNLNFWWRSYSDANWTAFDCGMEQFQNRYAIFVTDGDQGQELVFRVCAATLAQQGAEIYVPLERLNYKTATWYNIEVSCRGEDPTTMELLVDGVAVGTRRGVTTLLTDVQETDTDITVELAEGFPNVGALLIGTEIV